MQGLSSAASQINATVQARSSAVPNSAQAGLLKKALEAQKSDAAQLIQMLEGKGKIVDIRV
ncbi:MAG TPA: hypothetical protein VK171_02560 [Fimbriimonas sp.]|nr:hypothetical protein [Fimbriimonas sp.]